MDPLCRGLRGIEPWTPKGLARGRPEGERRAAAPDQVRVREEIMRVRVAVWTYVYRIVVSEGW